MPDTNTEKELRSLINENEKKIDTLRLVHGILYILIAGWMLCITLTIF